MADEDEEAGGGGAPGGGGALKKYGPLAAIVLVAQLIITWVLIQSWPGSTGKRDTGEDLIPETELRLGGQVEESKELPFKWGAEELARITANPAGTNATRFAVLDVELGLQGVDDDGPIATKDLTDDLAAAADMGKLLVAQKGKIRAIILRVIRSKTIDQLENDVIGDVMDEIRRELNQQVFERILWDDDGETKITVQEVDFTGFIVQ